MVFLYIFNKRCMKLKKVKKKKSMFGFGLLLLVLVLGVGYAAVNYITLDITGSADAKSLGGVYIIDATYYENVNASIRTSKINNFYQTMLDSTVSLAFTSTNSSITYAITVYNSTRDNYYFDDTLYSDEFYDNKDITFVLIGLNKGDLLESGAKKTFYIKFKYVDSITTVSNNVLNSYLNFKFVKGANLIATNFNSYSSGFWKYRDSITKIIVHDSITDIDGAITGDVSLEQDGSVISHTILNEDGSYTVYLQSDSFINLPSNSSSLFYNFMKLESIENINLLKTSKVTNINSMFMNDVKLQTLDVSSFDMSNVTSIAGMFTATYNLRYAYGRSEEDLIKLNDSSTGISMTCEFTLKS